MSVPECCGVECIKKKEKTLHVVLLQYYRSLLKGNYSLVYLALGPSKIYVIWSPTHPPIWVLLHIIFLVALFSLGYNNLFFPAFFSQRVSFFSLFNNQHGNSCLEKIIGMLGIAPNLTSVLFWSSELKEHRNLFALWCNFLYQNICGFSEHIMCLNHWSNQQISKREKRKWNVAAKWMKGNLNKLLPKPCFGNVIESDLKYCFDGRKPDV